MAFTPATADQLNTLTAVALTRGYGLEGEALITPSGLHALPLVDISGPFADNLVKMFQDMPKVS